MSKEANDSWCKNKRSRKAAQSGILAKGIMPWMAIFLHISEDSSYSSRSLAAGNCHVQHGLKWTL